MSLRINYGASVVLCTATQPAFAGKDGFKGGFDIDDDRELAPEPKRLYAELKRFDIEWKTAPVADGDVAARFAGRPQMLAIVNTRAHAKALFATIRDMDGACHLSTLMCPRHRRTVLAEIKQRLKENKPVRLVEHQPDRMRRGHRLPGGLARRDGIGFDPAGRRPLQPGGRTGARPCRRVSSRAEANSARHRDVLAGGAAGAAPLRGPSERPRADPLLFQ